MYRITVTKSGFITAVLFSNDPIQGEKVVRMEYGDECDYRVEEYYD